MIDNYEDILQEAVVETIEMSQRELGQEEKCRNFNHYICLDKSTLSPRKLVRTIRMIPGIVISEGLDDLEPYKGMGLKVLDSEKYYFFAFDFFNPTYLTALRLVRLLMRWDVRQHHINIDSIPDKWGRRDEPGNEFDQAFLLLANDMKYRIQYSIRNSEAEAKHREIIYKNYYSRLVHNIMCELIGVPRGVPSDYMRMDELKGLFDGLIVHRSSTSGFKFQGLGCVHFYMFVSDDIFDLRKGVFRENKEYGMAYRKDFIADKSTVGNTRVFMDPRGNGSVYIVFSQLALKTPDSRVVMVLKLNFRKKQYNWQGIEKALDILFEKESKEKRYEILAKLSYVLSPREYKKKLAFA